MSADPVRAYRFRTDTQWNTCLVVLADRDARGAGEALAPFAPYERPGTLYGSGRAYAPAITRAGEILWRTETGMLHRLPPGDDAPEESPSPFAIGNARRLAATADTLWAAGRRSGPLEQFETESLTRLRALAVPGWSDIAGDGDRLMVLVKHPDPAGGKDLWQVVRVDCAGQMAEPITLECVSGVIGFTFLRRSQRYVLLAGRPHQRLAFFDVKGGPPLFSVAAGALRPCFRATVLGSDARSRLFVAGRDGKDFGGGAFVLSLDADGNPVGELPLDPADTPVRGLAARRGTLVVAGNRGLLRFAAAETVPKPGQELQFTTITPILEAPDREDGRRWLRIEALATLPEGTSLELSVGTTKDATVRHPLELKAIADRLKGIHGDASLPAGRRAAALRGHPDVAWRDPIVLRGKESRPAPAVFSAPLFDLHERYILVSATLHAAPGARLPLLHELAVRYPGRTLMESLPAIYQRAEAEPDSFLRKVVGVLEATTQGLDESIAAMGSRIHPSTAAEPWLDFIARWLGWPWDDGLDPVQKRAIALRGADIAKGRGTRSGLEALLEALLPGTPRKFRVTDATADFGFATLGGGGCAGSVLPAMLGGFTRWSPELDSRAVLGFSRLPCADTIEDGAWHLAGRILVEVAATGEERRRFEPWLLSVLRQVTPLTVRVDLRWVSAQALRGDQLGDALVLEGPPAPHLGTDAVTGLARLPEGRARLSRNGPDVGIRLG